MHGAPSACQVGTATGAVTVSAWKQGCYCAKAEHVAPGSWGVVLTLRPHQENDNPAYEWMPPVGEVSCMSCKPEVTRTWLENDAHARSAVNPRFLTMYKGTDTAGNQSPVTRTASSRDYGTIPLRPDPAQAWFGPGVRLDFPDTAGNCACCHLPGSAVDDPYGVDPSSASGADTYGIHCDFCHKIADVRLDPAAPPASIRTSRGFSRWTSVGRSPMIPTATSSSSGPSTTAMCPRKTRTSRSSGRAPSAPPVIAASSGAP